MKTNRAFINSNEALLVINSYKNREYAAETAPFGDTMASASEAYQGVDALRFIRFDLETLTGEDVTEEVVAAWIEENQPDPDDCGVIPDFVRFSPAWEDYRDDWANEHGGRRRPYSTLNVTTQGLTSPVARV